MTEQSKKDEAAQAKAKPETAAEKDAAAKDKAAAKAKTNDDQVAAARAEADKAAEAERKDAEKRDEEQRKAAAAAAEAKGQPAEKVDLVAERDGVDLVNKGWTVQNERPYLDYQPEVGQAFVTAQLPDREVQRAAGIDPDAWAAGVVVLDDDEATNHFAGPEPDEARNLGLVK